MILVLMMLCSWFGDDLYTADEMTVIKLLSATTDGDVCVLAYGIDKPPFLRVAVFNLKQGKARFIKDGRARLALPFTIPTDEGFTLINAIIPGGPMVTINREGNFLSSGRLKDLPNWDANLKLTYACPAGRNKAYVTFRHETEPMLFLGYVDLAAGTITYLTQDRFEDGYDRFWAWDGQNLLRLTSETTLVEWIDPKDFNVRRVLRKAETPEGTDPKYSRLSGKYVSLLGEPIFNGAYLTLRWTQFPGKSGNPTDKKRYYSMALKNAKLSASPYAVLGTSGNRMLVYYWGEKILEWKSGDN